MIVMLIVIDFNRVGFCCLFLEERDMWNFIVYIDIIVMYILIFFCFVYSLLVYVCYIVLWMLLIKNLIKYDMF